jgi:Xaa-Pro dipeptidase
VTLAAQYKDHVSRLERAYAAAAAGAGFDGVVIHSGTPAKKSERDDQYWPLRPTPAFAHWLPLAEPDCALILRAGRSPVLVRTVTSDFWEGAPPSDGEHFWGSFTVHQVADPARIADYLAGRLAFIGDDRARAAGWGLGAGAIEPPALMTELDAVRRVKSDYERSCIGLANRRAAVGHRRVVERFRAGGASELDLHLAYLEATGQDDAETPYKNIVALDAHAATLHHIHYGRRAAEAGAAHSLLVDAGATAHGYASDVTRTEVIGDGAAADQFRALVARVGAMQQALSAELRPGIPFEDLHDRAHRGLAAILCDLGVGRAGADELHARGVTRVFLPHGLGHSLGIQVHDVGCRQRPPRADNPFLRTTIEVFAGMVVTIEPGCYFIEPLLAELRAGDRADLVDWKAIDALRPFGGVRIEDNLAVLPDGTTANLTRGNW